METGECRSDDVVERYLIRLSGCSASGWPLTAWLESTMGWRGTCLVWAALHLVIALPLNAMLPAAERAAPASGDAAGKPEQQAALPPAKQLSIA